MEVFYAIGYRKPSRKIKKQRDENKFLFSLTAIYM